MPCPKNGETGTSIYGVSDWAKPTIDYTENWVLTIQKIDWKLGFWMGTQFTTYSNLFWIMGLLNGFTDLISQSILTYSDIRSSCFGCLSGIQAGAQGFDPHLFELLFWNIHNGRNIFPSHSAWRRHPRSVKISHDFSWIFQVCIVLLITDLLLVSLNKNWTI